MSKPVLLLSALALFLASAGSPQPASTLALRSSVPAETLLKEADHKKVGELVGECIEAYLAREGQREAEEALNDNLKKKWTKAAKGRDPLALSDDLAASLWYSIDYTKVKGVKKGKIVDFPVTVEYYGPEYVATSAIWVPKDYSPKEKYPVVLCLPEPEEKPEAHLNDHWADNELRDHVILIAVDMPDDVKNWGGLGVRGSSEGAGGVGVLLQTYSEMRNQYAIDFEQVFLAGRGAGVGAAMNIANLFPDRFSGLIGRTGDATELPAENLSNLPCYFAGAGKLANDFAEKAGEEGDAARVVKPDAKVEDIWAWMQTIRRRSNPEQLLLVPGAPFPNKAYWVEVPSTEYTAGSSLKAKVDRASNTITVDAKGIRSVTIYLNDTLVDLDKPVKVNCNGALSEDKIPRNFNSTLDLIYKGRSDPGRIFTAWKVYDIPAEEVKDEKK